LGVYRVQETIKEEFVANGIQVEMQCCHLYIVCHATRAVNVIVIYRAKHAIGDNDMV
jgi:hypothetical protein